MKFTHQYNNHWIRSERSSRMEETSIDEQGHPARGREITVSGGGLQSHLLISYGPEERTLTPSRVEEKQLYCISDNR